MNGLIAGVTVLAIMIGLIRFMLTGSVRGKRSEDNRGRSRVNRGRQRERRGRTASPTRMLRSSTSRNRYSSSPPSTLWIQYALGMATGAGAIFDSASIYSGVAHHKSGDPTNFAVVMLLVALACLFSLVDALPKNLPRDYIIRIGAAAFTLIAADVDPWFGGLVWAIVVGLNAISSRRFQPALDIAVTLISYVLLYHHDGADVFVLAVVMTVLIGVLTMLIAVARRTVGFGLILVVLVMLLIGSGVASKA